MTTIAEMEDRTKGIFGGDNGIPIPEISWQRKLDTFEAAGLLKDRARAIFSMRCEQAEKMGFQKVHATELVTAMMGEAPTTEVTEAERQNHEWFYNHHTGVVIDDPKKSWGCKPTDYIKTWRKNGWWLPPFNTVRKWTVRFGKISQLKRDLPPDISLRLVDMKSLKLFNAFSVLAPLEAFETQTDISPVVIASIWEIPPDDKENDKYSTSGFQANYFLAKW